MAQPFKGTINVDVRDSEPRLGAVRHPSSLRRPERRGLLEGRRGPVKPVRIWSRIGKRPILAAGNSNGDIPMLRYTGGRDRPALRLLVHHDDDEREFAYTAGAETSLERAAVEAWTVISIKNDWAAVFAD